MCKEANMKVKEFVTYKCKKCNNVMRNEYRNPQKHKPCSVCLNDDWKQITMKEI